MTHGRIFLPAFTQWSLWYVCRKISLNFMILKTRKLESSDKKKQVFTYELKIRTTTNEQSDQCYVRIVFSPLNRSSSVIGRQKRQWPSLLGTIRTPRRQSAIQLSASGALQLQYFLVRLNLTLIRAQLSVSVVRCLRPDRTEPWECRGAFVHSRHNPINSLHANTMAIVPSLISYIFLDKYSIV